MYLFVLQILDNLIGEPLETRVETVTCERVGGLDVDRVSRDVVQSQLGSNLFVLMN